ncbi:hypothetical protein OG711_14350 [Streptomyces uncialis]|uniref:hypothetical protein n=1 Tax=Streptomyces uncialis TaxID=1048205 RepID=UPI002E3008A6|nr:hypothetical protein [Streptomyces uncialis]
MIDTGTRTITATVPVGNGSQSVALTPDDSRAYTANAYAGTVSVIDTGTNTVTATVTVGQGPVAIAVGALPAPDADLAVALAATPVPGLLNGRVNYTLTLTNDGPATLTSATVTATLPGSLTATSPDCTPTAGKVTCTLTNLPAGDSVTRHFTLPVALLTLGRPYTVTATRTASAPTDPNPANDTATRTCTATTSLIINCT